jgi:hypothetical protein
MNFFEVPQEEVDAVREAIASRGLDPKSFAIDASTDLLAHGPVKTVITVARGSKSIQFYRAFDDEWVTEVRQALESGAFDS